MLSLTKFSLPEKSGVYLFKDCNTILYIGKAKNLRKRVSSYFKSGNTNLKTEYLIKKANNLEWIVTNNEVEALILENNLIKKHKPKFNIRLVDDKTYPYIKIDIGNPYPTIKVTRRKDNNSSIYFGPYTSSFKLKQILDFIHKNFNLRKCSEKKFRNRTRPCLNYQIKICPAPCCNKISETEYRENIDSAILFLKGENSKLIANIRKKMLQLSENLEFEKAAFQRDLIKSIESLFLEQIMEQNNFFNKDLFYFQKRYNKYYCIILNVKKGKVLNTRYFDFKDNTILFNSFLEEVIPKYYSLTENIPDKIVVSEKIDFQLIKNFLEKKFKKKVDISTVKNESDKKLLQFARENIEERIRIESVQQNILQILKKTLDLTETPKRIDAFDISTFRGKSSVGTRVSFVNSEPAKKFYRKYIIRSIDENFLNDFAMIEEVVARSCKEFVKTGEKPDIILVDGGKGQLNAALKALKSYNLDKEINLFSIAKEI